MRTIKVDMTIEVPDRCFDCRFSEISAPDYHYYCLLYSAWLADRQRPCQQCLEAEVNTNNAERITE